MIGTKKLNGGESMAAQVPEHLLRDRYWRSTIFLFQNHPKLQRYFTTKFFDLEAETVKVQALKRESKPWSESEKFMLKLALHLFNDSNRVDLGQMDYLDRNNSQLALKAIELRYL